jgi:uncharacterized protein (TIGR00730 family)
MADERKVVIFCSSSHEIDPAYGKAARQLVRALCAKGYTIVSGGSFRGMMGDVSDEVVRCGGRHVGVLPRFLSAYAYDALTQLVWTDTMAERKEKMREGTCAAIALPGGPGTLDELFETWTLAKLGQYPGKVIAYDAGGFYAPLRGLVAALSDEKMLDDHARGLLRFATSAEEILSMIESE